MMYRTHTSSKNAQSTTPGPCGPPTAPSWRNKRQISYPPYVDSASHPPRSRTADRLLPREALREEHEEEPHAHGHHAIGVQTRHGDAQHWTVGHLLSRLRGAGGVEWMVGCLERVRTLVDLTSSFAGVLGQWTCQPDRDDRGSGLP